MQMPLGQETDLGSLLVNYESIFQITYSFVDRMELEYSGLPACAKTMKRAQIGNTGILKSIFI